MVYIYIIFYTQYLLSWSKLKVLQNTYFNSLYCKHIKQIIQKKVNVGSFYQITISNLRQVLYVQYLSNYSFIRIGNCGFCTYYFLKILFMNILNVYINQFAYNTIFKVELRICFPLFLANSQQLKYWFKLMIPNTL